MIRCYIIKLPTSGLFLLSVVVVVSILLVPSCLTHASSSSDDVKVIVYKGPKKCSNKNLKGDDKPTRVEKDYIAAFHFTVTIDESSAGPKEMLGKKIESSYDKGFAPSFPVGRGKVIAGLDRGLIGLCKGSSAYIIVPPHLGYGMRGVPEQGVRGDTTLRYDVEIVDIQPPIPNDFIKIDTNEDWEISYDEAMKYFDGLGQQVDLDSLFKDEDKDGDGYISWEEFTGPKGGEPPPKKPTKEELEQQRKMMQEQKMQEQQQKANEVIALLNSIDTDKDGKISKAELADMFLKLGQPMTEEFWEESDSDGDGFVTFEEFVGSDKKERGDELVDEL